MKILIFAFYFFVTGIGCVNAQMPENADASQILLGLKKLQVLGSVLYIAAHPDDENNRLLAWLSKDKLYRTGYLSLTRGDGGQNLIGDEQGIELGLIRTQELLAARRVDGAEQFFARAYDFGFSKSTAEALKIWDEQKILSDVVWVIRKFQPDIIITRFPEDQRAGHGQHSASSVLARLAFRAAADPKQFPEQFAFGVKPWQAKRLFWNNYNFGNINTTREDQLKINVGGFNPLIGKSYGEIAADSRSQHRSQGFGVAHSRGNQLEYFSLTEGEKADTSLMQSIDCSWNRVPGGTEIGDRIRLLIKNYEASFPVHSLDSLVSIYRAIQALPAGYWRDQKSKEIAGLIRAASGLWLEATVGEPYAYRNQTVIVNVQVINRSPVAVTLKSIRINGQDTANNKSLLTGENYSSRRPVSLRNLPVSQPYWLVNAMSPGSYNVYDQTQIGMAQNPPSPSAGFDLEILGQAFHYEEPVYYKFTDPVRGEQFQPFTIIPSLLAYCDPPLLLFDGEKEKELTVRSQVKINRGSSEGTPVIHPVALMKENAHKPADAVVRLTPVPGMETGAGSSGTENPVFRIRSGTTKDQNAATWATRLTDGISDTLFQCRTISYDHIPRIDYLKPAKSVVVSVNLKIRGARVGYIEGAGDKVPDALIAMGYSVIPLNENSVTASVLKNLDAVITGLRAYDVHEWLASKYDVLMEYVKNGGNLIVQYNRNQGDDSTRLGPYPFGISNVRITEEDAPVRFLLPAHRVLHFPNEITHADFDGWIQERGIYFAQHIDPGYASILSMQDTGDAVAQSGSLIIGDYGKGSFTYTGLVFFRELPAGVPGAYRLLANLIALNQSKDK